MYFEISFPSSFPLSSFLDAGMPLLGCLDLGDGAGRGYPAHAQKVMYG